MSSRSVLRQTASYHAAAPLMPDTVVPENTSRACAFAPDLATAQPQIGPQAAVAVDADQVVGDQRGAHHSAASLAVALGGKHEAHGLDEIGCQPQPFAPFANRLAHAPEIELLQISDAAVKRAQAVAAGGMSKIGGLDERDAEPGSRGFPRCARAMHATADNDDVVVDGCDGAQVPVHASARLRECGRSAQSRCS